jgi:molybdopterin synthase sulfur carrier subunit
MTVTVRYFAVLRDRAGMSEEVLELGPTTARELVEKLIEDRKLGLGSQLIRVAVNNRFVDDQTPLRDGDQVVLIPPVAGG